MNGNGTNARKSRDQLSEHFHTLFEFRSIFISFACWDRGFGVKHLLTLDETILYFLYPDFTGILYCRERAIMYVINL